VDVRPPFAAEGRDSYAVTHLALLGVKMQEPAFWGITKDKGGFIAAFLLYKIRWNFYTTKKPFS